MSEVPENSGQLGRYTLVRRIGKGGMGEVWLAKSTGVHGFEKNVALKRILPHFSSNPHVINMLVDEARISVLLNHPNVVQVLELGEDQGEYFIAMEYVEGKALSRLTRRLKKRGERIDALECCFIVIHVLEGLHAAHIQKDHRGKPAAIIHRDVSPQNVLLSMDGLVKVIDFGIARARERLEVTRGTGVKGKLRYMAPEQLSPGMLKGKSIDHRVDVFAAGIVLFELLAGRLRFSGDSELEIMNAILKEDTPDLCREGIVDRELMDILDTALEKNREHRFKDAASFASQLRSYLYKRDPTFTAERIARRMRDVFAGDREEEEPPEAGGALRNAVELDSTERVDSLVGDDGLGEGSDTGVGGNQAAREATRTAIRPRVRAIERESLFREPTPARGPEQRLGDGRVSRDARPRSRVVLLATGVIVGSVLLAVLASLVIGPRRGGAGPGASGGELVPDTIAPGLTDSPARASDGLVEVVVEAEPAITRISLADQPDPKYVSPAHLRLRPGDEVELVFEADGYEPQRRRIAVSEAPSSHKVALTALPVDLVLHVYPRDAVISVNGEPARLGMKVVPGQLVEVRAEHPFAVPRVFQGVPRAGEPFVVELRLEEVEKAARGGRLEVGRIVISSQPPGAEVFVDGVRVRGNTPLETTVLAGPHRVTVRAAQGEQTFPVDLAAGETVKREIVLE